MTVAGDLARFVINRRYEDIPSQAIDYAAMLMSSTVASASLGFTLESSKIMRTLELQRGGVAESTLWFGGGPRLPVAAAARVNALMSDAAASDDSDLRNITHPGTALVAVSLAVAETTAASGKEVLSAIVLGYEVAGRINGGVVPGLIEKGYHGNVITIFGGAVAAGLLLHLSETQMTHALALAATSVAGIMAAANTSTAREHHAGLAAMLGVNAAQLAKLGYTAEERIFELPRGFFYIYGQDAQSSGRLARVTADFDRRWDILTDMAIKLVPGGHPHHAMAEAAANASRAANVPAGDIAAIICSRPNVRTLTGPRHPTDLIGMAHSPAYFAAASVADREFSWAHASAEKIMDPTIRRLLDLVQVGEPPTQNLERYKQGATVTVTTADNRSFSSTVYAPRGSAILGIDWADVDRKFRTLCPFSGIPEANMEKSIQTIHAFRDVREVKELVQLIA